MWDWVILDADSKLVISLVVGPRTAEVAQAVFEDFAARTDGVPPLLVTTDALAAYEEAIRQTYPTSKQRTAASPVYATLVKRKEKNRVVEVTSRVVIGSKRKAKAAQKGQKISTSYVERYNATSRHLNGRKARKSYCFSKDLDMHLWVGWLCLCFYNFCWTVRTLRQPLKTGPLRFRRRTPAMAAGLASDVWTIEQLLRYRVYRSPPLMTMATAPHPMREAG